MKKKTYLTNLIEQETWVQAKVPQKDQELTNRINSLDQRASLNAEPEESKQSEAEAAPSDYLVSTNSGDESSGAGRKYKIVKSCTDFQRILFEYITLARQFEGLAPDAGLKVIELI